MGVGVVVDGGDLKNPVCGTTYVQITLDRVVAHASPLRTILI